MQRKRIILAIVAPILILAAILAYVLTHRATPLAYSGTIETREIEIGSKIGGRVLSPSTPPSSRPNLPRPRPPSSRPRPTTIAFTKATVLRKSPRPMPPSTKTRRSWTKPRTAPALKT
jgi:hypothetical protein